MKKIKALLAEDEAALGQIIKESLESRDFDVLLCENGQKAFKVYKEENPDILILDVMMPVKDGFSLAKEIRLEDSATPIIFLTSKSQPKDVVEGFSLGGNDYLKKPFSIEELIVRIHNQLDRKKLKSNAEQLKFGSFQFYHKKQLLISGNGDETQLTHRENELLYHLIKNRNELLDRKLILNKLWGKDDFFSARSMDVFVSKLRKKLASDESVKIVNVRGYGYKLIC